MPLDILNDKDLFSVQRGKINAGIDKTNNIDIKNEGYDQVKVDFDQLHSPQCRKINFDKPLRFVIIGASIMNGTFGTEERREAFIVTLRELGVLVQDVTEYATGGWTSTSILANLPTPLADLAGYEDRTIFLVHAGGNDVSASGPYPGGAATLESNYTAILTDIISAGFFAIPCSITYRIPPASNPSAPYNSNSVLPEISKYCPESIRLDGRPVVDLYQYTMLTEDLHDTDGIHYTSDGYDALGQYIARKIPEILSTGGASSEYITDLVIDMGDNYITPKFGYIGGGASNSVSSNRFYDVNGKQLDDLTVSITGFSDGTNSSGKNYSSTDYALDNTSLTRDSIFVSYAAWSGNNGQTGIISFSGSSIEIGETYNLSLVASRNVAEDGLRWGEYTVGGVTKELSGADSVSATPNIIAFSVTGAQLIADGIRVERRDSELDSFAYLNGIRIAKV